MKIINTHKFLKILGLIGIILIVIFIGIFLYCKFNFTFTLLLRDSTFFPHAL